MLRQYTNVYKRSAVLSEDEFLNYCIRKLVDGDQPRAGYASLITLNFPAIGKMIDVGQHGPHVLWNWRNYVSGACLSLPLCPYPWLSAYLYTFTDH